MGHSRFGMGQLAGSLHKVADDPSDTACARCFEYLNLVVRVRAATRHRVATTKRYDYFETIEVRDYQPLHSTQVIN